MNNVVRNEADKFEENLLFTAIIDIYRVSVLDPVTGSEDFIFDSQGYSFPQPMVTQPQSTRCRVAFSSLWLA